MILNAAAADLIQRAGMACASAGPHWRRALTRVAHENGSYLNEDVRLALLVVDELGLSEAMSRAREECPLDRVSGLFDTWLRSYLASPEIDHMAYTAMAVAVGFTDYERGRFAGMVESYVAFGPMRELSEDEAQRSRELAYNAIERARADQVDRAALGFDDDDPVAS